MMSAPRVYAAISAITAEFARTGIAKSRVNASDDYLYRGIDDVMKELAPLLAKHRLCILPRVLERMSRERAGTANALLISVTLRVAFDFISVRDGSVHTIEAYGEALDGSDKATNKAMSASFKYAVLQAFCIPVQGSDDADASSHRLKANQDDPDPDQGWDQWSLDIQDIIRVCETGEALDRVQSSHRSALRSASKRRPDVYAAIGEAIRDRRRAIAAAQGQALPAVPAAPSGIAVRNGSAVHA